MKRLLLYFLACVGVLGQPTTTTTIPLRTKADITAFTVYSWQTNLNAIALEEGNSLYRFHPGSAATADGSTILNATGVAGKWIVEPTTLVGGGTDASTAPVAARNLSVPQYVANYAALVAVNPDTGPQSVVVTDSLTGGLFVPVAGGTYSTNAGCVFTNAASGKLWVRHVSDGVLRSVWFPAGTTLEYLLDLQQAAFDQWPTLQLAPGVWTSPPSNKPITNPVVIAGSVSPYSPTPAIIENQHNTGTRLNVSGSHITFRSLKFQGWRQYISFETWRADAGASNIRNILVEDCLFDMTSGAGTTDVNIRAIGTSLTVESEDAAWLVKVVDDLTIRRCEFRLREPASDSEAMYGIALGFPTRNLTISDNRFYGGSYQVRTMFDADTFLQTSLTLNQRITGNLFADQTTGFAKEAIQVAGRGGLVANNLFTNLTYGTETQYAAYIQASAMTVDNNVFTGISGKNLYGKGVEFNLGTTAGREGYGIRFTRNRFSRIGTTTSHVIVEWDGEDCMWSENVFESKGIGLLFASTPAQGSSGNINVTRNHFYNTYQSIRFTMPQAGIGYYGVTVADNAFVACSFALRVSCLLSDSIIRGNIMEDDGFATPVGAFITFDDATYTRTSNLVIRDNITRPGRHGYPFKYALFHGSTAITHTNLTVVDNTFSFETDTVGRWWSSVPAFVGTKRVANNYRYESGTRTVMNSSLPEVAFATSLRSATNNVWPSQNRLTFADDVGGLMFTALKSVPQTNIVLGTNGWQTIGTGAAITTETNVVTVTGATTGATLGFYSPNNTVERGRTYLLSFSAYANESASLATLTTAYGRSFWRTPIALTTSWANYEFEFESIDASQRIAIYRADRNNSADSLHISNVVLRPMFTNTWSSGFPSVREATWTFGQMMLAPVAVTNSIAAVTSFVQPNGNVVFLAPTNNLILTSTPTVAPGLALGQRILLSTKDATYTVTVQDNGTLSGSTLELGDTTRAIALNDVLELMWNGSSWIEVNFQNN